MKNVCAFTSVCEDDARWIDQFQAEAERLALPYVIHLDRCSNETRSRFVRHDWCVNYTSNKRDEFNETHKQFPFDVLVREGDRHDGAGGKYDWAMAWDVDETHAPNARVVMDEMLEREAYRGTDMIDVRWLNLWESPDRVRTDGAFQTGHRVRFFNLRGGRSYKWYDPKVNGPRLLRNGKWQHKPDEYRVSKRSDFVVLHWGMMTKELRDEHRARWDRIYGRHGGNPYGFWNFACDESITPRVEKLEDVLK